MNCIGSGTGILPVCFSLWRVPSHGVYTIARRAGLGNLAYSAMRVIHHHPSSPSRFVLQKQCEGGRFGPQRRLSRNSPSDGERHKNDTL
jgi:hypothetical protein